MIVVRSLAVAGLLLSGCFYLDPVVERPVVTVHVLEPSATPLYRGDTIVLTARYVEEDREGTYAWTVFACSGFDGARGLGCATIPFDSSREVTWELQIPAFVNGTASPVRAIFVRLEARDDRGVLALGGIDSFAIGDRPPGLSLRRDAPTFTVGAPINVFARYGDPDDGPAAVSLDWRVFTPASQPAYELEEIVVAEPTPLDEPGTVTAGRRLVPHGAGEWTVQVTARDPLGQMTQVDLPIVVAEDRPPCLAQWAPITPPDGATLPILEPTVFQVPQVVDDLDAQPRVASAPQFGEPVFTWSILPDGASVREPLASASGHRADLDPAAFTPGDVLELRVEIFDRKLTPIPCPDSAPTCSVISQPTCLQRLTWRLEVR